MVKSKLKDIYEDPSEYNEIKVCDLQTEYINPSTNLAIKKLAIELNRKYIFQFIFILFFNILIGFGLYDFLTISTKIFVKEFFLILAILISFLILLINIGHAFFSTISGSYKKAQYGIVKNKFFEKDYINNKIVKKYYANIIFPTNNTFLRKVRCNEYIYNSISEGCNILIISFDNKLAHIILINE